MLQPLTRVGFVAIRDDKPQIHLQLLSMYVSIQKHQCSSPSGGGGGYVDPVKTILRAGMTILHEN